MSKAKPRAAMPQMSHCRGVRARRVRVDMRLRERSHNRDKRRHATRQPRVVYETGADYRACRCPSSYGAGGAGVDRVGADLGHPGGARRRCAAGRSSRASPFRPATSSGASSGPPSPAPTAASCWPRLPVGAYDVRAELAGFKTVVRQGVPLTVGEAVALEFTLEVGALAEAVSVVGAAPAVNTRTGDLSYLVDERDDRAAAAERPQLHRPGVPAARRHAVSPSRRRIGGGPRPGHGRERPGPARQRVPARRHAC